MASPISCNNNTSSNLSTLDLEPCQEANNIKSDSIEFPFRITNHLPTNLRIENEEALKKALERVKTDYPEELETFSNGNDLVSEASKFDFFKISLGEGCCYGTANALFDKICRGTSASILESLCQIQDEDVFYHHILQDFLLLETKSPFIAEKINNMQTTEKLIRQIDINHVSIFSDASLSIKEKYIKVSDYVQNLLQNEEAIKAEGLKQIQNRIENLKRNDHSRNFLGSNKFLIESASDIYQEALEETMNFFPGEKDVVGLIHIPNHVIGFQFGPRGYFLYDPFGFDKGLFKYFDPQTFYSQLREHALFDVRTIKQDQFQLTNPNARPAEIQKDAEERLKKAKFHFAIRPLRHINPFLEARDLPPIIPRPSEGWGTFV